MDLNMFPNHGALTEEIRETRNMHCMIHESLGFVNDTRPGIRVHNLANSMRRESEAIRQKWIEFSSSLVRYNNKVEKQASQFRLRVLTKPAWYLNGNALGTDANERRAHC